MPGNSPFIFHEEIDAITRLCDMTRKRMERRGLFPKRVRIAPRRIAWRRADIEAWASDPEGWAKRHGNQIEAG
ncbi:putative DNA-binding transcriptional regulator AlpA [Nitrobacter vulgaris]|uniref:helix-turn-helix transcriptional regulator n=1 Tax=Nitrobacter vulgaris TaxID=29421 RepID=UPI002863211F|nr:AlpA family phage regulatory protein [Nitrobacter vulgaris]MDR6303959.1 putative DNA-binding transcriptional regulator AlpA [Nitrobacter vulgaris]